MARSTSDDLDDDEHVMRNVLGMCFDPRVLGGLAVVGLGIWIVAPQLIAPALPILLLLVCPLSMLFMARMMGDSMKDTSSASPANRLAALEREQARLDAEIARARVELTPGRSSEPTMSRAQVGAAHSSEQAES